MWRRRPRRRRRKSPPGRRRHILTADSAQAFGRADVPVRPAARKRGSGARRAQWGGGASPPHERLTDRELEVVRLMSGGYSNKVIAHALGTAEGTIKNHVSSILVKLGARDRTRAVLKALESGLL